MYAAEWPCCHDPLRFSLGSDDLLPRATTTVGHHSSSLVCASHSHEGGATARARSTLSLCGEKATPIRRLLPPRAALTTRTRAARLKSVKKRHPSVDLHGAAPLAPWARSHASVARPLGPRTPPSPHGPWALAALARPLGPRTRLALGPARTPPSWLAHGPSHAHRPGWPARPLNASASAPTLGLALNHHHSAQSHPVQSHPVPSRRTPSSRTPSRRTPTRRTPSSRTPSSRTAMVALVAQWPQ